MMIGLGFPAESVAKIIEGMTGPAWNTVSVSTNPMNLGAILLLFFGAKANIKTYELVHMSIAGARVVL